MYAILSLCFWTKLNEWNKVESIVYSAWPLNSVSSICFQLFGEDPSSSLPSSAPRRSNLSIYPIKSIKTFTYLAPTWNLQRSDLIPGPKICFPISPAKTQKPKNKHTYLFTSLKSVLIISHLASYCLFSRDWRREPSPVLVGLATRLSMVWCSLEIYFISAWGRFER